MDDAALGNQGNHVGRGPLLQICKWDQSPEGRNEGRKGDDKTSATPERKEERAELFASPS